MKKKSLIYLIGFMASGKTSVGRKIAKHLAVEFIDLDHLIEEEEKRSISEIFLADGEAYFRKKEAEILRNISADEQALVALGGGTVCHSNNMKYVNKNGTSIYLRRSNDRLLGRLRQKKAKRPLIADLTDQELKTFIDQKMNERIEYYEQAQLLIDADAFKSKKELTEYIVQTIAEKTINS